MNLLLAGCSLHSLYTFHPLTCMSYIEHDSLIVTGSGNFFCISLPLVLYPILFNVRGFCRLCVFAITLI